MAITIRTLLPTSLLVVLAFEDAKNFQSELFALLARYQAKSGAQDYLARIALTPVAK